MLNRQNPLEQLSGVRDYIGLASEETGVIAGTLVEGIGTPHSDLDIYVFSDTIRPKDNVSPHNYLENENGNIYHFYDYWGDENYAVDVKYFTWKTFECMVSEIDTEFQDVIVNTKLKRRIFGKPLNGRNDFLDMSHKLLHSKALSQETAWLKRQSDINRDKLKFILFRSAAGGYPEFKDIAGFWQIGDVLSCVQNLRWYLFEQMRGYTHLLGNTNFKEKWLLTYLDRMPGLDPDLVTAFMASQFDEVRTKTQQGQAVFDMIALIERIWQACGAVLNEVEAYPSQEVMAQAVAAEFEREEIKDVQTEREFAHRRLQFGLDGPPLKEALTT